MKFRLAAPARVLLLALLALAAPVSVASASNGIPLSEYGKLPDVEMTAISPSGDRIAMVTTMNGQRILLAIEDQTKALRVIGLSDRKVRSLRWIGEERLLLTTSRTQDLRGFTTDKGEFSIGQVIPIDENEEATVVFANNRKYVDSIQGNYGIRQIDGEHFGFFGGIELKRKPTATRTGYVFDHARPHLYKVNLKTMKTSKVSPAASMDFGRDWLIDAKGEIAYRLDVNYTDGKWTIRNAESTVIARGQQTSAAVSLRGLSYDGSSAIFVERGEDASYWYEIGQNGGTPKPFLEGIDWQQLFFDPANGHLMGYTIGEGDNEKHIFADKSLQAKAKRVREAFASFESWMSGWTSDLSDVIVRTTGNGDSGTYYAVDLETSKANAIAYSRIAIEPQHVGAISTFEYTASDGMEMDGILTLPPGKDAKDLPVVILPHGGPHSADAPIFDWWAQAFASRGYAVFQPNFRGSTNRSAAFRRAGYGEWGRKMQTDKSDGLMALAEKGIVDPDRACIVGASYGGYAALAGVTIQQGLYKCAVAVAPVSDLKNMYSEDYRASGRDRTTKVALLERLGDRNTWDAVSPLRLAEQADAPIMLIHGKDDVVVPYSHSTRMADKLKDAGKTYEMVTLEGEDHWLSLSPTRQLMLENAVRWVEKYNPAE